jgi:hypothetical protein
MNSHFLEKMEFGKNLESQFFHNLNITLKSIIWIFVFLNFNSLGGQVNAYAFTQSTETYTQVVGTNSTATDDDGIQGPISIGFNFVFDGTTFTQFSLNTNGLIKLGNVTIGGNGWTNSLSNSAVHRPLIAALWDDNHRNIGSIQYLLSGSSPNRTLEIGFHNVNIGGGGSISSTNLASYKIRLHETTNVIEFVYGPTIALAGGLSASIGLNGASSFLSVTPGTTATISSATANNGISSTTNLVGKKYTFTPPAPPVAIDAGISGGSASVVSSLCAGNPININATVKNFGTITQNAIPVYYTVNGSSPVGPINTVGPIAQNGTQNVLFNGANAFVPAISGTYTIVVYTDLSGDLVLPNNSTTFIYTVGNKLSSFPYSEPFTSAVGWSIFVESAVGTTGLWGLSVATLGPDGIGSNPSARANFFNGSAGRVERLQSPVFNFEMLANPIVHYYVAHKTFQAEDDELSIVVSTDCGFTFTALSPAYVKSNSSIPSLSTLPPSTTSFLPSAQNHWRHESIDLSAYAGLADVMIAFRAASDFGNLLWIDNFIVSDAGSICDDVVSAPGVYSCEGNASINMNTTGDPAGGTIQVASYTSIAPNSTFAANTSATSHDGSIYTPVSIKDDEWFKATYAGNTFNGYANYDISIDVTGYTPATNPNHMYIMKRADQGSPWVCLPTTASGNVITASGLTTFSEFAVGYTCVTPTIALQASPTVCSGSTQAALAYSSTTGSPDLYSIDFDAVAETAGFVDVVNATLGTSPIMINGSILAGVYHAELTVTYALGGCVSEATSFTITINSSPVLTANATQPLCATHTGSVALSTTGGQPSYTYSPSNPATTLLTNGNYTYTVTDANTCSATAVVVIVAPTFPCIAPEPVCGNIVNVYANGSNLIYNGPGTSDVYRIDAIHLDAGSTTLDPITLVRQVKRKNTNIAFNWTTNGACIDATPNGVYNNNDKGIEYKSCLPVAPADYNLVRSFYMKLTDQFGTAECEGKFRVIAGNPPGGNSPIHILNNTYSEKSASTRANIDLFDVFPNPANNVINIKMALEGGGNYKMIIKDITGREIQSLDFESIDEEETMTIDVSQLNAGAYFIFLKGGSEEKVKRWMKI